MKGFKKNIEKLFFSNVSNHTTVGSIEHILKAGKAKAKSNVLFFGIRCFLLRYLFLRLLNVQIFHALFNWFDIIILNLSRFLQCGGIFFWQFNANFISIGCLNKE